MVYNIKKELCHNRAKNKYEKTWEENMRDMEDRSRRYLKACSEAEEKNEKIEESNQ